MEKKVQTCNQRGRRIDELAEGTGTEKLRILRYQIINSPGLPDMIKRSIIRQHCSQKNRGTQIYKEWYDESSRINRTSIRA